MRYAQTSHVEPHRYPEGNALCTLCTQLWEQFLSAPPSLIACDTETNNLEERKLIGIGVAISATDSFYITADDPDLERLLNILRSPSIAKVWHNTVFDLRVLRKYYVDCSNVDDTAIMARIIGREASLEHWGYDIGREIYSAKAMMEQWSIKIHGTAGKIRNMTDLPQATVALKCLNDCEATYILYHHLKPKVNQAYYAVERQLIPVLETMSQKGIRLDPQRRDELEVYYTKEVNWSRNECEGKFGFNPASPAQVGMALAKRGNFLPFTRSKTQLATDDATLRKLSDPIAQLVLMYRHHAKMLNTYIRPFAGADRAYTSFHTDAITGRTTSTSAGKADPDRNLQNIPKKVELYSKGAAPTIRSMFLPDLGDEEFTRADDSQIELRVLAHLSRDQRMLSIFLDPRGDLHKDTAIAMGLSREFAKTFNYAVVYNADPWTVADNTGISDVGRVRRYMDIWMKPYPGAARWMELQKLEGMRLGYVESLYGRRLTIPVDKGEKHAQNCCINYPIQTTAGEIFKRQLLAIKFAVGPEWERIRLQIHDEGLFTGHVDLPSGLEHVSPVYTPVNVAYVKHWDDNE